MSKFSVNMINDNGRYSIHMTAYDEKKEIIIQSEALEKHFDGFNSFMLLKFAVDAMKSNYEKNKDKLNLQTQQGLINEKNV